MHHLGVGAKHARKRVLALADNHHITVTDLTTREVLSTHLIEPKKTDCQPGFPAATRRCVPALPSSILAAGCGRRSRPPPT